jgi:hypothetical protein
MGGQHLGAMFDIKKGTTPTQAFPSRVSKVNCGGNRVEINLGSTCQWAKSNSDQVIRMTQGDFGNDQVRSFKLVM